MALVVDLLVERKPARRRQQQCAARPQLRDGVSTASAHISCVSCVSCCGAVVLPLESTKREILSTLVDVTCQGVYVNALRPCVQDGVICSNEGTCANSVCLCNATRTGTYCESVVTDDLSTGAIIGIVVGVVVPVLVLLCLLVLAVLLIMLCCRNRRVPLPLLTRRNT